MSGNKLTSKQPQTTTIGIRGYSDQPAPEAFADGGMVGLQQPFGFQNALGYATGGSVGMPPMGAAQQAQPMDHQMMDASISDTLRRNPQVQQKIQQVVMQAVQSGQLHPEDLKMVIQLAKAAAQNPKLWPQLRQFCIQRGLCGPDDLPEQYDQGLVATILAMAKAVEGQLDGAQPGVGVIPPEGMGNGPQPSGPGQLQGPGTGTSDSIPAQNLATGGQVNVSNGEYIIPEKVVRAKGKDFFDNLIRKYSDVPQ